MRTSLCNLSMWHNVHGFLVNWQVRLKLWRKCPKNTCSLNSLHKQAMPPHWQAIKGDQIKHAVPPELTALDDHCTHQYLCRALNHRVHRPEWVFSVNLQENLNKNSKKPHKYKYIKITKDHVPLEEPTISCVVLIFAGISPVLNSWLDSSHEKWVGDWWTWGGCNMTYLRDMVSLFCFWFLYSRQVRYTCKRKTNQCVY